MEDQQRADIGLPPRQGIELMAGRLQANIMFMQLNRETQMICTCVYSHFASRKLNSVVNLSEKQKKKKEK